MLPAVLLLLLAPAMHRVATAETVYLANPDEITGSLVPAPDPAQPRTPPITTHLWLPFGLLDRMRLAPFHMSATTELGTQRDARDTASLTLHAQMSTDCGCNIGIYGTLPASIDLTDDAGATTGALPAMSASSAAGRTQTALGTLDVGLFGGTREGSLNWIYRVGALLPTGTREPRPWLASARVGDRVLELPRSAGVRLSTSRLIGWQRARRAPNWHVAWRFDGGIDVASVLALPGNPVHVIPRAGAGLMATGGGSFVYSLDTALSVDPFNDGRARTPGLADDDGAALRWSAGFTARYARADGGVGAAGGRRSIIQPALTVAATRSELGWSANVLIDLTASAPLSRSWN